MTSRSGSSGPAPSPGGSSARATNRLIRSLARTGNPPTSEQVGQILNRIGTAQFSRTRVSVDPALVGVIFQGRRLAAIEPSLRAHAAKRVLDDRMWAPGTTAADYLTDLRAAAASANAQIHIFADMLPGGRARSVVAVRAPTAAAVPAARRGPRAQAETVVFYEAERGTIVSGYQPANVGRLRNLRGVTWYSR